MSQLCVTAPKDGRTDADIEAGDAGDAELIGGLMSGDGGSDVVHMTDTGLQSETEERDEAGESVASRSPRSVWSESWRLIIVWVVAKGGGKGMMMRGWQKLMGDCWRALCDGESGECGRLVSGGRLIASQHSDVILSEWASE